MAEHGTRNEARESRINEAVQFVDDEFQRVQKELNTRRKSLEQEFATRRKTVKKRTRKELKRIQSELKKNPIVKRADSVRKDVSKQVETRVDALLGLMQVEAYRAGDMIRMGDQIFHVIETCGGLRLMVTLTFSAVILPGSGETIFLARTASGTSRPGRP